MNAQDELNEKIMKITTVIRENYPELHKYLNEMPVTIPSEEHPHVDVEAIQKYYDSLVTIFRNYVAEHQLQNANRVYKDHHL